MWRSSCTVLKNTLSSSLRRPPPPALGFRRISAVLLSSADVDTTTTNNNNNNNNNNNSEKINTEISICEAKKLMRLVNVEALKNRLGTEGKEVIAYKDLLESCEAMGVAKSKDEADRFVKVLDEAGVVLVFGERVYLHPDKIVELVKKAVPLVLTPEDNPMREELETLLAKKEQLDILAHKQVRFILWTGLGFGILQVGLFFRLTFWEFSWDVMEPIAFFTTATGIVIGYAYFLYTSRDPTYRDFMQRVFLSRQRKLMKKHNFDFDRFLALQKKCKFPFEGHDVSRQQTGMGLGRDTFH